MFSWLGLTDINYSAHSGVISCDSPNALKEIIKHPHRAGWPKAQTQQPLLNRNLCTAVWDAGAPQRGQQSHRCVFCGLWVEWRWACIYLYFYRLSALSAQIWWSRTRTADHLKRPVNRAGRLLLLRLWVCTVNRHVKIKWTTPSFWHALVFPHN